MSKALSIVPERCTGCMQCELACGYVQTGAWQPSRSLIRVNIFDELASYAPYTCFQCEEAWCLQSCPTNAIAIQPDTGAKVIIPEACVSCGVCTISCPFGTIFYDDRTAKASKCDLCDGDPACVRSCPTQAIEFEDNDTGGWLESWGDKVEINYQKACENGA